MMKVYGYIVFAIVAIAIVVVAELQSRRHDNRLVRTRSLIVAYNMVSLFIFLHAPWFYNAYTGRYPVSPVTEPEFQIGLVILPAIGVVQIFLSSAPASLFWRVAMPSVAGVLGAAVVFPFIGMGTINAVWLFLLQVATGVHLAIAELRSIWMETLTSSDEPLAVVDDVRREFTGFLKMGLQATLALGASVGVSMSILFRDGYVAWKNPAYQMNAGRLVLGFALISAGGLLWLVRPYLDNYVLLREYRDRANRSHEDLDKVDDEDA